MKIQVFDDATSAARAAASMIADELRLALAARGHFLLAVSGGHTPWLTLRDLAALELPWDNVHLFQTDERVAPNGSPDRNLTHIQESLLSRAPFPPDRMHAMPVDLPDLNAAAAHYSDTLRHIAGTPPVLDLVHLGLGTDGHTASLVPGDPVVNMDDADVALTATYSGTRRMTLTFPVLNRARHILWLVTGSDKQPMLQRLLAGDTSIPAGRVSRDQALVVADRAAAGPAPGA